MLIRQRAFPKPRWNPVLRRPLARFWALSHGSGSSGYIGGYKFAEYSSSNSTKHTHGRKKVRGICLCGIYSAQKVAREEMTKYLKESNIRKMLEEHVRKVSDGLYADMAQSPGHDIEENPEKRAP